MAIQWPGQGLTSNAHVSWRPGPRSLAPWAAPRHRLTRKCGTDGFMAPEIIRNQPYDQKVQPAVPAVQPGVALGRGMAGLHMGLLGGGWLVVG